MRSPGVWRRQERKGTDAESKLGRWPLWGEGNPTWKPPTSVQCPVFTSSISPMATSPQQAPQLPVPSPCTWSVPHYGLLAMLLKAALSPSTHPDTKDVGFDRKRCAGSWDPSLAPRISSQRGVLFRHPLGTWKPRLDSQSLF